MSILAIMAPLEPFSCSEMNAVASSSLAETTEAARSPSKTDAAATKAISTERAEKRKERELKRVEKAAKRQKVEANQKRSASFMSAFVQAKQASSPQKHEQSQTVQLSDYQRTFPRCTFKDMAPINRFAHQAERKPDLLKDARTFDAQELLKQIRADRIRRPGRGQKKIRKGIHATVSVRDTMRLITEAGVLGDGRLEENGRRGFADLASRKLVPMKLLHFESDRRPAWYGTWTRSSTLVGARRPFGQDPVAIDYSYDSDAEWEEFDPNEGDDVQDNDNDNDEDDQCSRSDSDSELDDWLVDDLEDEEEDGGEERKTAGVLLSPATSSRPRGKDVDATIEKKKRKVKLLGRRFESKLVKFETGPHWEQELGLTTYDGFRPYKMEMLNDAYIGLDPFSFKSAVLQTGLDGGDAKKSATDAAEIKSGLDFDDAKKGNKSRKKKSEMNANKIAGDPPKKTLTARPVKLKDKLAAKGLLEQAMALLGQMDSKFATNTCAHVGTSVPKQDDVGSGPSQAFADCAHLRETALESIERSYTLLFGSIERKSS